jgi:hypothetical protein
MNHKTELHILIEIIAIGRYSKEILNTLEYSKNAFIYDNLNEDAIITERLFTNMEGENPCNNFANLFGCSDMWDINKNRITKDRIDFELLSKFVIKNPDYDEDLNKFKILDKNNFEFYLLPTKEYY